MPAALRDVLLGASRGPRGPSVAPRIGRPGVSQIELSLLEPLRHGRCPICAELNDHDEKYLLWFVYETYRFPETVEALRRSHGFCPAHGALLADHPAGGPAAAVVHSQMLSSLAAEVGDLHNRQPGSQNSGFLRPTPCPACVSREEKSRRTASFLSRVLADTYHDGDYGSPGVLCHPHLQLLAPLLGAKAFREIVTRHATVIGQYQRSGPEPLDGGSVPFPAFLIAEEPAAAHYPSWHAMEAAPPESDAVAGTTRLLDASESCLVCNRVRNAWCGWMRWLIARTRGGARMLEVQDLLPTCSEHVGALLALVGSDPVPLLAGNILRLQIGNLTAALRFMRRKENAAGIIPALAESLFHRGGGFTMAREAVGRHLHCPVCRASEIATERALDLLLRLLDQPHLRARYERGFGLCLRHFARALAMEPGPEARSCLIASEAAQLRLLHWELEEYRRKMAWSTRWEERAQEQQAPRKAIARFSGGALA